MRHPGGRPDQPGFYRIRRFRLKLKARLRGLLPVNKKAHGLRGQLYEHVILNALEAEEEALSLRHGVAVTSAFGSAVRDPMIRKKLVKDMFDQLETANWLASQDFDSIRKLKEQRDLGAVEKVYAALAKAGILGTKEQ